MVMRARGNAEAALRPQSVVLSIISELMGFNYQYDLR